jgi:hypothetical protein
VEYLSVNPNVTWEFIQRTNPLNWNYSLLSKHPNITFDIIVNNPQFKWDYQYYYKNPNLDWNFIMENLNLSLSTSVAKNFIRTLIAINCMSKSREKYINDEIIKHDELLSTLSAIGKHSKNQQESKVFSINDLNIYIIDFIVCST